MKRLYLIISLTMLAAIVLSSVTASQVLHRLFDKNMRQRMREMQSNLAGLIVERLEEAPESEMDEELSRFQKAVFPQVEIVPADSPAVPQNAGDVSPQAAAEPARRRHAHFTPFRQGKYYLVMKPPTRPGPSRIWPFLLELFVIFPIVGVTGYLLISPIARRLRILENATVKIGGGDLSARADIDDPGAVGDLARRFNEMADRIQTLLENQKHLLLAVSHELRTPISRIRFNLEMLSESREESERVRRAQEMEEELVELNDIVEELLLYLKFDSPNTPMEKGPIEIAAVLGELIDKVNEKKPEIVFRLHTGDSGDLALIANEKYFKRALQNLLDNAIRYAEASVIVACAELGGGVSVTVSDDGPGIPPQEYERIFEPFGRLDDSRSRRSGGVGLGLAIVRRILQRHGGTVSVSAGDAGGAKFTTVWPQPQP